MSFGINKTEKYEILNILEVREMIKTKSTNYLWAVKIKMRTVFKRNICAF